MENTKKENIFSRIINKIKEFWKRMGEEDIFYSNENLTPEQAKEVANIEKVQKVIHEGFVAKVPVNEQKAKIKAAQTSKGGNEKPKELGKV